MEIVPIQTGTVRIRPSQVRGNGHGVMRTVNLMRDKQWTEWLPIIAWLIVHDEGMILVDTGESARAMEPGWYPRFNPYYRYHIEISVTPEQGVGNQLRARGVDPRVVRTVLMTHLHTDHAGGLADVPNAEVWVSQSEWAQSQGLGGKLRGYLPQHFPDRLAPKMFAFNGDDVAGLGRSHVVTKAGDVRVVQTSGHTGGHVSVIVSHDGREYFIAGDASYNEAAMREGAVDGLSPDEAVARTTLANIRGYVNQSNAVYLPTHDPQSITRLQRASSS